MKSKQSIKLNYKGAEPIEIRLVRLSSIKPNRRNANRMTVAKFEALVDNIERHGCTQPLYVRRYNNPKKPQFRYELHDGFHRWKACKEAGLEKVPVVVQKLNKTDSWKQTLRMNNLRGELDHAKFKEHLTKAITEGEITFEDAAFELGFEDQDELQLIMESARAELPNEEAKREFDRRSKKAKTVDEIYSLVMTLLKKYGDTLPANFMIIAAGRNRNLWIKLEPHNFRKFEAIGRICLEQGVSFDSFIVAALKATEPESFIEENKDDLDSVEAGIDSIEAVWSQDIDDKEVFEGAR